MMRPLFAAAAAVLLGAGVPAANAQCGCGRPTASVSTPSTSPGVKTAVPVQSLKLAIPTTVHHVTPAAPASGCAACLTAVSAAAPVSNAVPATTVTTTPAAASCPHCAPTASLTPDDKPKGDEKPAAKADKEVTLTGTMACAKCGLKEPGVKKCTNAIQVKDGDMTVTYFLDDKGNGETYHEGLCGGGTKAGAKVTGTVTEKDGKRWVKVTKVEEPKEKK